jgi:AcrR family transcriptional regulator
VRPEGRSQRIRETVARACLDLLAEAKVDLTHVAVAERAGVSRTTLYRWWPTSADLLREAAKFHNRRLEAPDTGSWAGDVEALSRQLAEFFCDPIERAQNSLIASGQHREISDLLIDAFEPVLAAWRQVIARGVDRGEVLDDLDIDTVIKLVASPLLVITVLERRDPTHAEVEAIGRLVIRATSTDPSRPTKPRKKTSRRLKPHRRGESRDERKRR